MSILRNRLVRLGMVVLILFFPAVFLPFAPWLLILVERVSHSPFWSPAALMGLCLVAGVLPLPALIPVAAAGFLLGIFVGSLVAVVGTTLGACAAFLLARTAARDWVARWITLGGRLAVLDRAVGEQGFKIVFLTRLSPLAPFLSLNYAFGLTRVSFRQYAWGTLLGGAPGTTLFVLCGAGLHSLREVLAYAAGRGEPTTIDRVFFWFSLVATVLVSVWLTHFARRALHRALPGAAPPAGQDQPP